MSMHPIIIAAKEFDKDEDRREKRGQKLRMPNPTATTLHQGIRAVESTVTPAGVNDPINRVLRGDLATGIFGYQDTADEAAATVIADILHAVAARGFNPQTVLDQAAAYYAEEVTEEGQNNG